MPEPEATPPAPAAGRLLSLDALRGFDMFWIVGADGIVEALLKISKTGFIGFLAYELDHAEWEGFRFEDLIFPLFVFMMGTAIPLSLDRIVQSEGRRRAHGRLIRRALLLYVIGILYYGGAAKLWPEIRLVGVLHRIAFCYLCAGLLYLNVNLRGMIAACAALLLGYWALLAFVPAPGMSHVSFLPDQNWPNYIDLHYLPGRLWNKTWDPEGILSNIPAVATALLGVFAGLLLRNRSVPQTSKVRYLFWYGAAGAALGLLWGLNFPGCFPVIKKLWTSSYVLVAGGFSAMLLAVFYYVIDVRGWSKWATPFFWIGTNSLTIYLAVNIIQFNRLADRFVGGDIKIAWGDYGDLLVTTVALTLELLFLRFLYNRKIFLRL